MRTTASSRSRRIRHEATRVEILEAAAQAIAEHGYHGMTMRGLARATGRALANFYNYFTSKEDLLFAIQAGAFETLNTTVEAALAGVDDPVARLYVFILHHLRYVAGHQSVMRTLVHEAAALPAGRRRAVRVLKERYFHTARTIVGTVVLDGCQRDGALGAPQTDDAEIDRATYSLFGMLNWSYGWYDPERHGTASDVARTMHSIALCGLVTHCPHRAIQKTTERYLAAIVSPPLLGTTHPTDTTPRKGAR